MALCMGTTTFHTFYLMIIHVIDVLCEMTWVHVIHGAGYEDSKNDGHVTVKHVHTCREHLNLACIIQRLPPPI